MKATGEATNGRGGPTAVRKRTGIVNHVISLKNLIDVPLGLFTRLLSKLASWGYFKKQSLIQLFASFLKIDSKRDIFKVKGAPCTSLLKLHTLLKRTLSPIII
ncbi:CDC like kinase 4 [Phyllostomus discolor]|uniref:CDC like kinase 4 n=1 Tax=Phyllostomus discolor TaxID=89673 RepID=A0A833YUM4_9CHIR|nr:CDC like kinase 4 [Phyllostomus discolor]